MRLLRVLPWLLVAGLWLAAALAWPQMPETMPVHWNAAGEVDRWGSRAEGVLALPAITTGLLVLFRVLPRFDPGRANFAAMHGAWATFQVALVLFLGVVYGAALGVWEMARVMPLALGGLFIVLGSILGKVRPNYMFGIRTPWTLASKRAWTRTHRAGGFGFLLAGLGVLVTGLAAPTLVVPVMLGALAVLLFGLVAYSWRVWAGDPDKIPPGGTTLV